MARVFFQKKQIAALQHYRCANEQGSNLDGLKNYLCPLWKDESDIQGIFDESGYQIDHIMERAEGGSDDPSNLQALSCMCHSVKTNRYMIGGKNNKNKKPNSGSAKKNNKNNKNKKPNGGFAKKNNQNNKKLIARFECDNCPYKTNHKGKFDAHLSKIIPCNKYRLNKNVKEIENYYCEQCNKNFSRGDSLFRHIKTFHENINIDDNRMINVQNGNKTKIINPIINIKNKNNTTPKKIKKLLLHIDTLIDDFNKAPDSDDSSEELQTNTSSSENEDIISDSDDELANS